MALNNLLLGFAGLNVTGDVGPLTVYRSRRGALVFYPRMPALNPPSALQLVQRNRWTMAARMWKALLPDARANWERATKLAGLRCQGYNLFVFWASGGNPNIIRTITNNTGVELIGPT